MKVNINNKETETQALNVKQLAEELNLPATGVAVAISNNMCLATNGKPQRSSKALTSLS